MIVTAQSGYTVYKQFLRIEDGLSSNNVTTAVQDNKGFMWFGTSYGLNKYDGKKFKSYTQAKNGLNSNLIEKLAIDDANRLWIISGSVLQVMNLVTNEIQDASDLFQLPFEQNQIVELANNGSSEIQIITKNPYRLWCYSSFAGFVKRYDFSELNSSGQISLPVCCFQNSQTAVVFPGYPKLFLFGRSNNSSFRFEGNDFRPIQILNENEVVMHNFLNGTSASLPREKDFLKVNVNHLGFEYLPDFMPDSKKDLENYRPLGGSLINSKSYASRIIGLKIRLNGVEFELLNSNEWNELNGGSFYSLYSRDSTNFWGLTTNGILHLRLQKKMFSTYFKRDNISSWEGQVRGIYAEDFSPVHSTGELRANVWQSHCEIRKGIFKETSGKSVLFPLEKIQGNLYSANAFLMQYSERNQRFENLDTTNSSEVWSVFQANENIILTGRSPGIFAFNMSTRQTVELTALSSNWPKPQNVYRFVNSKFKGLVAVAENGLFMLSNDLRIIDFFGKDAMSDDHQIPVARIYDWHEDSNGNCWLASGGEGLLSWRWSANGTLNQNQVRSISIDEGLPSTIVYRIEEDNFSNLWISTYNGLVRYNLLSNDFRIFTVHEGLSHNEFNRISSFKDKQGRMYFGGMNGLNFFDPQDFLNTQKEIFPFQVISISKFSSQTSKEENCDAEYNSTGRLVLNSGDLFLKVDFAFLTYYPIERGFEYKLEGAEDKWIKLIGSTLQIGSLPQGEYTLRIRARLPDGTWNSDEIIIPIIVNPPFYLKWWFLISAMCVFIGTFGAVYKYRTMRQRKRLRILDLQISSRTNELRAALDDKEILLKEVHHRVKNNLQVISGLLQLQKDEVKDESLLRVLSEGQSRLTSIALIHKNIYQNENLESVFLQTFISELYNEVKSLFSLKGCVAEGKFNMNNLTLNLQNAVPLGLILNELMTNSFKHAVLPNEVLEIRIEMISIGENEFELLYQDNGPGLPFNFEIQLVESLGMRLIYGLTAQINGTASVESREGLYVKIQFSTEKL